MEGDPDFPGDLYEDGPPESFPGDYDDPWYVRFATWWASLFGRMRG